uniref:ATP synthase F0 subunit 8 n=1 Tax=Acrobeloides nanus TaxID=290746 RepID=A0A914CU35_9BILA
MNNLTDLPSIFCSTPLFIEITKNSSISESLSECMGLVALPAIPTFLAIISVIFLLIYGKIFCRECQPLKMSNKVSFTKMVK